MIELAVRYQTAGDTLLEVVVFSADYKGHLKEHQDLNDLTYANPEIDEVISDIEGIQTVGRFDAKGSVYITYNSAITSWRDWYIKVIDAIMTYYNERFDEVREVVHYTEAIQGLAVEQSDLSHT